MKVMKFQLLLVLGLGAVLGYVAATGPSRLLAWVGWPSSAQAANTEKPATAATNDCDGCCPDGADKARLLAMADPKVKQAVAKAEEKNGKKPNIVVIMGDDIGIWNIGAYHRGLMAGRTPNLDKLAKEG